MIIKSEGNLGETRRNVEPSNPIEYIKWMQETVRLQGEEMKKLHAEYAKHTRLGEDASVGLSRLRSLVTAVNAAQLQYITSLYDNFVKANESIIFTLQKCDQAIKATIVNYQLVAETLKAPLADKHKKIAVQKEMGLRLQDIDTDISRAKAATEAQKKLLGQLSDGIQDLMAKASVKLPPKMQEDIIREDAVRKLANEYKVRLEEGRDTINPTPYNPATKKPMRIAKDIYNKQGQRLGEDNTTSVSSYLPSAAAVLAGAIIGVCIFNR